MTGVQTCALPICQVILEMEDRYQRPVRILLYGENGTYCFDSIKDLLPFCFVDSNMKE